MQRTIVEPRFALSIKQPWATLVVLGLKSIEIRRWTSPFRGRIYIHSGRIPDDRSEGWARVPEEHFALTNQRGGLVGTVELTACVTYASLREFRKDRQLHLNDPSWFLPPRLFGLRFEKPELTPFRAMPGQVKFFSVPALPIKKPVAAKAATAGTAKKVVKFELEPTNRALRHGASSASRER